jgi:uncharacterized protein YndB with AHSA1/START domain
MAEAGSQVAFRLQLRRTFQATRERVFRAWTEGEALKHWYAPGEATVALAEVDLRVGGQWRVHMRGPEGQRYHVSGMYREVVPPSRLVFTWQWETDPPDHVMVVTVELLERGRATEVVLTHEGFRAEQERNGHQDGWGKLFDKLDKVLASAG